MQTPDPGPASDVKTLVVLQVPQVGETLATLVANELFLPSMYLLVGFQGVALVEAASAGVAGVRLLSRVDTLVSVEVPDTAETLPAGVTAEWFLPRVDHLREQQRLILNCICRNAPSKPTWCDLRLLCCVNVRPQMPQENGLSPLCVFR